MGRANVYLPDELERRVKAAQLPISEICQRALWSAVEAAEGVGGRLREAAGPQFAAGFAAGTAWTTTADTEQLLLALRDNGLPEVPPDALAADFYTLTRPQSLAWEAGFMEAVRVAVRAALPGAPTVATENGDESARAGEAARGGEAGEAGAAGSTTDRTERVDLTKAPAPEPELGDDSGCRIGSTVDGVEVSFDPHSAVRAGRSPLFAVLGPADQRTKFLLSVAQDAASRGAAVVVVDVSGSVAPRAGGQGRNVRIVGRGTSPTRPLEDLLRGSLGGGAVGLGGLWEMMGSFGGSGLGELLTPPQNDLLEPGYVSVLQLSADGGLSAALALGQAAHSLTRLGSATEFPRLLLVDLPAGVNIPAALGTRLGQLVRTAREQNTAVGIGAEAADTVANLGGGGALLSTVFAFATGSPVEAARLRALLGIDAPILLNPPGATVDAGDETWVVMRDLQGRLGQVRLAGA